jgi:hypothetical protein
LYTTAAAKNIYSKQQEQEYKHFLQSGTVFLRLYDFLEHCNRKKKLGYEVLTAVVRKSSIFWDKMTCSPLQVNLHFRGRRTLFAAAL